MRIKIVFEETPSWVGENVYVWASGDIDDAQTNKLLDDMRDYVLRSLNEMGVLRVATP